MDDLSKVIGANIRKYRTAIKMTTTELADLSGASQSTISQIENGRSTNVDTLIKICSALKITLIDILPATVLPDSQTKTAEKKQLLHLLEQMSEGEIRAVQTILTTNIIPFLKTITPFVKSLDELDEEERRLLSNLLYSIVNKK